VGDPDWPPTPVPRRGAFGRRAPRSPTLTKIEQAELALSAPFPDELRQLYLVCDGYWDEAGQWFVIWPLRDLLDRNAVLAEDNEWSETDLVAFGDDGTGNPYCFSRGSGPAVFYWSHIDAQATYLAPDFARFWRGWTQGMLPPH
jgi:SMI1-KNR4 cell-wall